MREVWISKNVREHYERLHSEERFNTEEKFYSYILDLIRAEPYKRILDVGCGKSTLLLQAQERRLNGWGIDISFNALKDMAERGDGLKLIQSYAEFLPFKDNSFDYLVCLGSLEHFIKLEESLKEMARVIKPDGYACFVVPNSLWIGRAIYELRYRFIKNSCQPIERLASRREWEEIIERNGFKIIDIYKHNLVWTPKGPIRIFYKLLIRPFISLDFSYHFIFLCKR